MNQTTRPSRPVRRRPQRRSKLGCLTKTFIAGIILFALFVFAGIGLTSAFLSSSLTTELETGIERLQDVRNRRSFETTVITDRNGVTLWEIFGEGKRTVVPLEQMPLEIKAATIAVEDDSFYTNKGFDEPSLLAAVLANYRNPDSRPIGGSTITQQLVRHVAFDYEERVAVSYRRKVKELFLAWRMTQDFTKDEILELYLNEIYYGNLAYGIEAASQTYFAKSATDLTLGEATLLAGLPQAPIALDPYVNSDAAKARQWFVLNLMYEDGMVNQEQMDAAYLEELTFVEQTVSLTAPHFAIEVRRQLEAQFGAERVANDGLRVTTTLDVRYQRLAEQLASEHVAQLTENNLTNAALVAMKPATGEVLAMLGSVDYNDESIDGQVNVALSPQQPGSTFKPLTFALALESGWRPDDVLWDVPVNYPQLNGNLYEPVNYDGRFHGPMRLREALANSYNIPALLLADAVGVEPLLQFARGVGLNSLVDDMSLYGLSLTLGGAEVTQLEMTQAYATLANGGLRIEPTMISRVETRQGEVLFEAMAPEVEQLVSAEVSFLISDMLADDAARTPAMGADNPLDLPFTAAAKTGTTNDFRDNWTIGYTPGLVVSVWTGNTDNSPMVNVSGLTGAAPLWNAYMQAIKADGALANSQSVAGLLPPIEFIRPNSLTQQSYCNLDTLKPNLTECPGTLAEWSLGGAPPELPEPTAQREYVERSLVKLLSAPLTDGTNTFCAVGEGRWPAQTEPRLFIARPNDTRIAEFASKWAAQNGVLIEPSEFCGGQAPVAEGPWTPTPSAIEEPVVADPVQPAQPTATPQPTAIAVVEPTKTATPVPTPIPPTPTPPSAVVQQAGSSRYAILSPANGQTLNAATPILGTAVFDAGQVQFYKLEIRKADSGAWVTIGDAHSASVEQGLLEILPVEGLINSAEWGPGAYELRLVLVKWDGNDAGAPYVVSVTLE